MSTFSDIADQFVPQEGEGRRVWIARSGEGLGVDVGQRGGLNKHGRAQAAKLGSELREQANPPEIILVGSDPHSHETAIIVGKMLRIPVRHRRGFDLGPMEQPREESEAIASNEIVTSLGIFPGKIFWSSWTHGPKNNGSRLFSGLGGKCSLGDSGLTAHFFPSFLIWQPKNV